MAVEVKVEVERSPLRRGKKPLYTLYIDLGARCLATLWAEGWNALAFSGNRLLHD